MITLIAVILCFLASYLVVGRNLPVENNLLKACLAAILTALFLSFTFTLFLFAHLSFVLFECTCLLIPLLVFITPGHSLKELFKKSAVKYSGLSNAYLLMVLLSVVLFTYLFFNYTHRWGDWDGWAIWNMHAKFLASDTAFTQMFSQPLAWTHPDYPLMLPSLIAIAWHALGSWSPLAPVMIAYGTGVLLLLVLYAAFCEKKLMPLGAITMIVLTGSKALMPFAGSQYADTLLSICMLLPFVLFSLYEDAPSFRFLILTGLFAAACCWIKNEGVIFFLVFSFYFALRSLKNLKQILYYILGCVVPLLVLAVFKAGYATESDMIAQPFDSYISRLLNAERYMTIFGFLGTYFLNHPQLPLVAAMILLLLVVDRSYFGSFAFWVLGSMLVAIFFVYVLTPNDLTWHLNTSCDRLLHQLFPAFVFTMMLRAGKRIPLFQSKINS